MMMMSLAYMLFTCLFCSYFTFYALFGYLLCLLFISELSFYLYLYRRRCLRATTWTLQQQLSSIVCFFVLSLFFLFSFNSFSVKRTFFQKKNSFAVAIFVECVVIAFVLATKHTILWRNSKNAIKNIIVSCNVVIRSDIRQKSRGKNKKKNNNQITGNSFLFLFFCIQFDTFTWNCCFIWMELSFLHDLLWKQSFLFAL